jgi:hypothetical protein
VSVAIVLALALAAPPASQAALPAAAAVTAYPASYFAASQPNTALDMVRLLPGFTFDPGAQARGLSSPGNVLIDGARPAAKDDSVDQVLQRIPAASVLRIDVIRGGAPGIDMQGRTIIANLVRRRDLAGTLTVTASGTHGLDARRSGSLLLDGERKIGPARIEVSLQVAKLLDDSTGYGAWTRVDGAGRKVFSATESNLAAQDLYKATGELDSPLWGGKLTFNASGSLSPYNQLTIDTLPPPAGSEIDRAKFENDSLEFGLRYEHPIGARLSSETYGLQRFGRVLNPDDFQSTPATVALTGDDLSDIFSLVEHTRESIVRETLTYPLTHTVTLKAGVEGDDNRLTSATSFIQNGAPVALPAADVTVSELRGEVFASAAWQARPNLLVEAGFREEASRITSSGDVISARDLVYPKPRLAVTWTPDKDDQFRLRIEREIGQLDFTQFVAQTAGINTGTVVVGNPNLSPNQDWAVEADWDRHFWRGVVLTLSYQRQMYDQLVDRVGVNSPSGEFDSPGDIGAATVDTETASLTLPTDRLGVAHGLVTGTATLRQSRVIDPTTGLPRPVTALHSSDWEAHFSQGVPKWNASWGVDVFGPFVQTSYRFDEVDQVKFAGAYLVFFVEYKPRPDLTVNLQLLNLLSRRVEFSRQIFNGPRNLFGVDFTDIHDDSVGPLIKLKIIKAFS